METADERVREPGRLAHRFVGRTRPLHQVAAARRVLDRGRGCVVVVSGEAGVGKTWFCDEVADQALTDGIRVATARCWLDSGAPPLWPWQSLLSQLGGDPAADLQASGRTGAEVGPDRFARFVAVTDRLAQTCARGPVCLVIDDVHGADAGTLLLIRFVARSLSRLPLALVLSRRSTEPTPGTPEARLLGELEDEATSIALRGFDLAETRDFLAAHDPGDLDPELVTTLFQVTGGNPLFLRRIAETLDHTGPEPAVPGGLQVAIQQALDQLTGPARQVLSTAAVLGLTPLVTETARVAGCDAVTVLDAVDEGVKVGLVHVPGDGRFSFSHDLVRSVVESSLDAAGRLEVHARAAAVVAADVPAPTAEQLARAAHHARRSAARSPDDARRAVSLCRSAAQAMVSNFAYEQADALLSAAVELHSSARLGPPGARLALEWAQAASLLGSMDVARSRYATAVARAEAEREPGLQGEAALGLGGVWLDEHRTPVDKNRVLGLYHDALTRIPADDPEQEALRCRLTVRLAAEAVFDGGPTAPLHQAVEAARGSGDPHALAEALSLSLHALFTPEHTRSRLDLADELVRLTSETDQGVLSLMGLLWRTISLLHLGDQQAPRALEVLRQRATALGNQHVLYNIAVIDVQQLVSRGHLTEAEDQAQRSLDLGTQVGRVDAPAYLTAQLAIIRWMQGRDAELLDATDGISSSPTLSDTEFSFTATAACLAARAGELERARAILDRHLPARLTDLTPSGTWMGGLVAVVEAAGALEDADLAGQAYDLLRPYADLPAAVGLGIACLGSNERPLGLAAGVLGRHELAVEHLERAVTSNQRLGNRPMVAISRAELALALARRDGTAADRERSGLLLDRAVADATAMDLGGRIAAWTAERPPRVGPSSPSMASTTADGWSPGSAGPGTAPRGRRGVDHAGHRRRTAVTGLVRKEGRRWLVAVGDRTVRVGNLLGMTYLAELLTHPGQHIPAFALAGHGNGAAGTAPQALLDDEARSAYAARARELSHDLGEAEAANDLHRAERLRAELDVLVDHLESATGFLQRPRHFTDDNERARTAVRKAIKRAIDAIADADASIAEMLVETISTGSTCVYTPAPHHPVTWST